jgi:hypothetical protein
MRVSDLVFASPRLSEDEVALLTRYDLVDEALDARDEEHGDPGPPGFRERLARGDISW